MKHKVRLTVISLTMLFLLSTICTAALAEDESDMQILVTDRVCRER